MDLVTPSFNEAVLRHQRGDLDNAERLYAEVLRLVPGHPDALHNLGILGLQRGNIDHALLCLRQAHGLDGSNRQYRLSYAEALLLAGFPELAGQVANEARAEGFAGADWDALDRRIGDAIAARPCSPLGVRLPEAPEDFATLAGLLGDGKHELIGLLARQLKENFPDHPIGWTLDGAMKRAAGDLEPALAAMAVASRLAPDDAEIHYNIGLIEHERGCPELAEASYRRAIRINPGLRLAYSNLGVSLHIQRRYKEAESAFVSALDPGAASLSRDRSVPGPGAKSAANARVLNNLGNLLTDTGRLDDAERCYRSSVWHDPALADAWNNLASLLSYGTDPANEIAAYQQAMKAAPGSEGLIAAVFLAVRAFLAGNLDDCARLLTFAEPIRARADRKYRAARAYRDYLVALLDWHRSNGSREPVDRDRARAPVVIGDSHSLGFLDLGAGMSANGRCAIVRWVPGCKLWHLARPEANKYRHKVALELDAIAQGSTVVLVVGEIDCRADEGILAVYKKHPARPLGDIVAATVDGYLGFVANAGRRRKHEIFVCGVPAPSPEIGKALPEVSENVVEVVRMVNQCLREGASALGARFLDIHALTDRGDGFAHADAHIDSFHLNPSICRRALLPCLGD